MGRWTRLLAISFVLSWSASAWSQEEEGASEPSESPAPVASPVPATQVPPAVEAPPAPETPRAPEAPKAPAGPVIEVPPEAPEAPETPSQVDPMRGMQADRFRRAAKTSIGGYGELHATKMVQDGEEATGVDLHRLVIFLAHNFSPKMRFYTEIEVEHAFVGDGKPGEVGIEQAFVDYEVLGDALGVRAGVVLVPMGIINQWHEPPIFHGVERPNVDKLIIPSTWREGGVGVFGKVGELLSFEAYAVGGLNPMGFSASSGIRGGRQHVASARADGIALTGRVEATPMLGIVAGVSGYYGQSGPNAGLDFAVPVTGIEADARYKGMGIEARGMIASFTIGDTDKLRGVTDGPDIGSQMLGAYGEVAYNVFRPLGLDQELLPFVRYELYDTTFSKDDASSAGERATSDVVMGVTYRPIPQAAFKGDVILRTFEDEPAATLVNLGVGWMF